MSRRAFAVVTEHGEVVSGDVLDRYAVKAHSRQPPDQQAFEGVRGIVSPKYDPTQIMSLLEANTPHYRACRQKAQDTAGIGWRFDQTDDGASEEDKVRLEEFFDELPPPRNARFDDDLQNVFEAASMDYEAVGRGALEVVRVGHSHDGPPETIVHMPAHTVRVHRDGMRFMQIRGGKRRWYKWIGADFDVDKITGRTARLGSLSPDRRASEVIWWRNYHPADPTYGLADVTPAVGAIVGDLGRRDYNIEFFSNHGVPAYLVTISGDFDPGDPVDSEGNPVDDDDPNGKTPLEWDIEAHFKQMRKNPHSTLVLTLPTRGDRQDEEIDVEIKPLATEVKEASFRLYRKDNREEVLSSHGMSAAIAGVFDAGAADREALTRYKRSVIAPRQRKLERLVNRHIVRGAFGVRGWRWRLRTIDTRDLKRELDMWTTMLERGGVTLREFIRHFAEAFGIPDPGPSDANNPDPVLDVRQTGPPDGGETEAALRAMRDDLVKIAAKSSTNGDGDLPELVTGRL